MKTIVTRSGSFLTGTEIADGVSGYGLALARSQGVDVVDIPFVSVDGAVHRAQIRIGWLIDTAITSTGHATDDLVEADTILGILARTEAVNAALDPTSSFPPTQTMRWSGVQPAGTVNWDEVI